MRGSGEFFEGTGSVYHITVDPFVTGFARNPISFAEFGEGKSFSAKIGDELNFLVHR